MGRLSSVAAIGGLLLGMQTASVPARTGLGVEKIPADPNERVCEDVKVIGSRLAVRRVCATRAEWKIKRQQDREVLDDAQRHAADPCNSILTHTGPPMC